ncbi:MAG: AraC family transcriptional regulator [Treponema sp.]|jgi:AraC-like DNA-binding protein|nr:AraC family transcriptional regulator [Treponema sp.]
MDSFLHYLPYSEEDEKLGIVCSTAGNVEVPPNTSYPPYKDEHPAVFRTVAQGRILSEFHIIYIIEGQGTFETQGKTYAVNPGSVLFLPPGIWHRYRPVPDIGWHEYWVGFKGSFVQNLFGEGVFSADKLFFELGLNNRMIENFQLIFEEIKTQQPLYQFRVCSEIISLIAEIHTQERRREQPNHYQKIVDTAKNLMRANVFGGINLPSIAKQIGLSVSHLNEIFKTYTSMTPYQYFIQLKINKAGSLLENDISVKEAAYKLGFNDQFYFSRLFKSKTGVTPSEWKAMIRSSGSRLSR